MLIYENNNHTESDYDAALKRISEILDAKPGTEERAELEILSDKVWLYEEEHYPIGPPPNSVAIQFRKEQEQP